MNPDRFQLRRERLRGEKLCTRCGEAPARPGHATCSVCAVIKGVKDDLRRGEPARRTAALERARLKLELIRIAENEVREKLRRLSV